MLTGNFILSFAIITYMLAFRSFSLTHTHPHTHTHITSNTITVIQNKYLFLVSQPFVVPKLSDKVAKVQEGKTETCFCGATFTPEIGE